MEIACIVEGDGEANAVPLLVRRIIEEHDPTIYVNVFTAIVFHGESKFRRPTELARAVETAARRTGGSGAILVLLDSEGDCPAQLGPSLLAQAIAVRGDVPIAVVAANREFEAWFLAAAVSLHGHRGLADDLDAPPDCEGVQDAKGWLRSRMRAKEPYSPTSHQASFSAAIDLELARQRAPSFDKLCRDVQRLVDELRASESGI